MQLTLEKEDEQLGKLYFFQMHGRWDANTRYRDFHKVFPDPTQAQYDLHVNLILLIRNVICILLCIWSQLIQVNPFPSPSIQ